MFFCLLHVSPICFYSPLSFAVSFPRSLDSFIIRISLHLRQQHGSVDAVLFCSVVRDGLLSIEWLQSYWSRLKLSKVRQRASDFELVIKNAVYFD